MRLRNTSRIAGTRAYTLAPQGNLGVMVRPSSPRSTRTTRTSCWPRGHWPETDGARRPSTRCSIDTGGAKKYKNSTRWVIRAGAHRWQGRGHSSRKWDYEFSDQALHSLSFAESLLGRRARPGPGRENMKRVGDDGKGLLYSPTLSLFPSSHPRTSHSLCQVPAPRAAPRKPLQRRGPSIHLMAARVIESDSRSVGSV